MHLLALLSLAFADTFPAAPALTVAEWVRGEAVAVPEEGVVVVELWATWCGPCVEQLPHLSALSTHYDGQVAVAAVSDEPSRTVQRFLARSGEVAFSAGVDPTGATTARYQAVDGASGIPHAYIIDDGEVVWSGHPARIDPILAAVVSDRWSVAHAAHYDRLPLIASEYLRSASQGVPDPALGETLLQYGDIQPDILNNLSWMILTELPPARQDAALARAAAEKAVSAEPENASYLDTYALALSRTGAAEAAVQAEEQALALLPPDDPARAELEERLAGFKAAL